MTLAWTRRLIEATDAVRAGRFELGTPVRSLTAQRVGIVGFGGTGQAVARLFATLGVRCRAVSRSGTGPRGDVEWLGTMADLPRLLAASDVVVLAVPLTHATHGLVDEAFLAAMPEEALLVNVARGHVVDEGALWSWLDADHHRRAAALDVWWRYPRDGTGRPFTLPFERLPNVIMTPHNAPNVPGHRETMLRAALQDVQRFLEDGTVLHRADPADYVTAD